MIEVNIDIRVPTTIATSAKHPNETHVQRPRDQTVIGS